MHQKIQDIKQGVTTLDTQDNIDEIMDIHRQLGQKSTQSHVNKEYLKTRLKYLQKQMRETLLKTGQFDIQALNTGSPGYKLMRRWSEKFFQKIFGLNKDEIKCFLQVQAKYNGT